MGAYCMPCDRRTFKREGVGPTGNKAWMIRVDTCGKCGRHYPTQPNDLTLEQRSWVKRWNDRMGEQDEQC